VLDGLEETVRLSPRQQETIRLLAEGLTAKEIGRQMGISYRTVEAHLSQVRKQLRFHRSHRKLVVWAQEFIHRKTQSREDRIKAAGIAYRTRIDAITDGGQWRHPNLAAAAQHLQLAEEALLQWSANQRIERAREMAEEEGNEDVDATVAQ
jgi:DNA-binding CsgD family transcriptional regulator